MRLGTWLLSKGKITDEQLQKALQHREFFGNRLGSSLITLGYVDEDVLGAYLSDVSGTPYAPAARLEKVPPEVVALVPARLASQYRVVPIGVEGRRLRLAMRDPRDLIALDEIAFMTGMTIEPYVATDFRIQKALTRYYQVSSGTPTVPVAGPAGAPGPSTAPAPPAPRPGRPAPPPAASPASRPAEIGLDGYPLDADPDLIDSPFISGRHGVPPATGESDAAPPSSLEQWRLAQEEIPDEFPDPPTARSTAPPPPPRPAMRPPAPALAAVPRPEPIEPDDVLEAATARLLRAGSRDEVFDAILDHAIGRCRRAVLFIVQGERATGWGGRGPGIEPARIREVVAPLDRPSIFGFVRGGGGSFDGPVEEQPVNTRLYLDLGLPAPERALVLPLLIKERPMVLLYAEPTGAGAAVKQGLQRLLTKASLALEILILRNKIGKL